MNTEKTALAIRVLRSKVEHSRAPTGVKQQAKNLLRIARDEFDLDKTNDISFESNVIAAQSLVDLLEV